mgnify:CR=1 FL=1
MIVFKVLILSMFFIPQVYSKSFYKHLKTNGFIDASNLIKPREIGKYVHPKKDIVIFRREFASKKSLQKTCKKNIIEKLGFNVSKITLKANNCFFLNKATSRWDLISYEGQKYKHSKFSYYYVSSNDKTTQGLNEFIKNI